MWAAIKRWAAWLWGWILPVLRVFNPGERARWAAWRGAMVGAVVVAGATGYLTLRLGYGALVDGLIGAAIGVAAAGLGGLGLWLILAVLTRLPRPLLPLLVGSVLAASGLVGSRTELGLPLAGGFVVLAAILAAGLAGVTEPGFAGSGKLRKTGVAVMLLVGVGGLTGGLVWFVHPGTDEGLVEVASPGLADVAPLELPDPAEAGPFEVQTLTYGSGEDRRPEFGTDADLIARRVDATPFVNELTGFWAWFRHRYWGFEPDEFPLQGRVWHPVGDGPFPLVLVAHGNHAMRDYSDPGYAYLGELFASRGFILVSVDENFLNSDWSRSFRRENDARGWLLLEHLAQWRDWNAEPDHPFFGRVDMERIGLIGHSRGGEAVGVAAAFNRLAHYPDDATVEFDFNFAIRGIIAIAPVDGQYMPSGRPTPVRDVSYLVLHGSHDADVSSFSGDRLYKRLEVGPASGTFKAAIYIYRANHGQFNTVWGKRDWGLPMGMLLNTAPLLTGEEQRRIGAVYMSAFLEAALRDDDRYLPLFRDYRRGRHWLADTYYVNRFSDGSEKTLVDYGDDIDVTTAGTGVTLAAAGLATWREGDLGYRSGSRQRLNQVAFLGWRTDDGDADGDSAYPSYRVKLAEPVSAGAILFSAAQLDEKPKKKDEADEKSDEGGQTSSNAGSAADDTDAENEAEAEDEVEEEKAAADEDAPVEPLDFSIGIVDADGNSAFLPLSTVWDLMPPLKARFTRFGPAEQRYEKTSEPILQSMEIGVERFLQVNPELNPEAIVEIAFVFERSPEGVIALDEIGFRPSRTANSE